MILLTVQGAEPATAFAQVEAFGEAAATAVEKAAIEWLRKRGFQCDKAHEWETPKQLRQRLRLPSGSSLTRDLANHDCPPPADEERSSNGRLLALRSHAHLDAYLTRNLHNPTAAASAA
ncbi:hypothetical protein BH09VER1_BH09VER1_28700 [soil metagenome]